ncbi:MAG TPA: hypothetical protein VIM70_12430 [Clostridium sp.]|uniref:hypothetical protein n=1 Tax=Clostridium sp. TaxID=1506 RepID=UPI002F9464E0
MKNSVNVLEVSLVKNVQDYDLSTGEVGASIQEYELFTKQVIIQDLEPETIRESILILLEENYIEFDLIQKGNIFEESRLTFQTFENTSGVTQEKETSFFVDNDLYIKVNQGDVSLEELQEIFPEIPLY